MVSFTFQGHLRVIHVIVIVNFEILDIISTYVYCKTAHEKALLNLVELERINL